MNKNIHNKSLDELKDYAYKLNIAYMESRQQDQKKQEAFFALHIISIWYKYRQYITLMSKLHRQDLQDCITTHKDKYITLFIQNDFSQDQIDIFNSNVKDIIDLIKNDSDNINSTEKEQDFIGDRVYSITFNSQALFAEQNHNKAAIEMLQAISIAYSFIYLDLSEQDKLVNNLLLIKEIWNIENDSEATTESIKYKFHIDIKNFVIEKNLTTNEEAFKYVINALTLNYSVLQYLNNNQLIHIYDRLKNHELNNSIIVFLLDKLHKESHFRYSYNRLSEDGYELLSRFQSLDTLVHQLEKLELSIVENYLLNRNNFIEQFLLLILKHIDNIRVFRLTKNETLLLIVKNIESQISYTKSVNKEQIIQNFANLKKALTITLANESIQRKYNKLDKYTNYIISKKYNALFENILNVLNNNAIGRKFLKKSLIEVISKEFYLPNFTNSVEKIRKVEIDQIEVKRKLSELSLIDIFIYPQVPNKINNLNFRHIALNKDIKSVEDYISALIAEIVRQSTATQLEILYNLLLKPEDISNIELHLRKQISQEVYSRISMMKMFYSMLKGTKKEYDTLSNLSKLIKNI